MIDWLTDWLTYLINCGVSLVSAKKDVGALYSRMGHSCSRELRDQTKLRTGGSQLNDFVISRSRPEVSVRHARTTRSVIDWWLMCAGRVRRLLTGDRWCLNDATVSFRADRCHSCRWQTKRKLRAPIFCASLLLSTFKRYALCICQFQQERFI